MMSQISWMFCLSNFLQQLASIAKILAVTQDFGVRFPVGYSFLNCFFFSFRYKVKRAPRTWWHHSWIFLLWIKQSQVYICAIFCYTHLILIRVNLGMEMLFCIQETNSRFENMLMTLSSLTHLVDCIGAPKSITGLSF